VLLQIDVSSLSSLRLPIRAFTAKTIMNADKPVCTRWEQAKLDYRASEAERIGVDAMINSSPEQEQADEQIDAPATIKSDLDALKESLVQLEALLDTAANYVKAVQSGSVKPDAEVGRQIVQALSVVPHLDQARFQKMFSNSIQTMLMVVYLANLTRTQVALADKITSLLQ